MATWSRGNLFGRLVSYLLLPWSRFTLPLTLPHMYSVLQSVVSTGIIIYWWHFLRIKDGPQWGFQFVSNLGLFFQDTRMWCASSWRPAGWTQCPKTGGFFRTALLKYNNSFQKIMKYVCITTVPAVFRVPLWANVCTSSNSSTLLSPRGVSQSKCFVE